jgi:hypothetical protein
VVVVTGDAPLMLAVLRACPTLRSLLGTPIELTDLDANEARSLPFFF